MHALQQACDVRPTAVVLYAHHHIDASYVQVHSIRNGCSIRSAICPASALIISRRVQSKACIYMYVRTYVRVSTKQWYIYETIGDRSWILACNCARIQNHESSIYSCAHRCMHMHVLTACIALSGARFGTVVCMFGPTCMDRLPMRYVFMQASSRIHIGRTRAVTRPIECMLSNLS